jgi:hypothetical protein
MRYYFHLVEGQNIIPDNEGVEVADPAHIRSEAAEALKEIRKENPDLIVEGQGWRMDVTDASGAVLFSLPLD